MQDLDFDRLLCRFTQLPPALAATKYSKMTTNTSNIVFDDIFTISAIDKEGKKFDRGARKAGDDRRLAPETEQHVHYSVTTICAFKELRHGPNTRLQRGTVPTTSRPVVRTCPFLVASTRAEYGGRRGREGPRCLEARREGQERT